MGQHRRRTRKVRSGSNRAARERTKTLTALGRPASAPSMGAELAELRRLISRYPDYARQLVAGLPPPTRIFPARH
jgi:hypothetical protein